MGVAALLGVLVVLAVLQYRPSLRWWIELSRYLPYYWWMVLCGVALGVSMRLGRGWRWAAVASCVVLGTVTSGLTWNLLPAAAASAPADRLRLLTYNIKAGQALQRPQGIEAIGREIVRHRPDVVVMQDADGLLVPRHAAALSAGEVFGFAHLHAIGQYVVASRFPLRECTPGTMDDGVESHRYLRCTVAAPGGDFTLVTAHFLSPRGGLVATRTEGLEGRSEWHQNFLGRLAQARALAADMRNAPRPLVVAGDLNAPEASPVVQVLLATGLRDAFSAAGRGYGFSYGHSMRAGLSFLRIDHILVSHDIAVTDSFVGASDASEHRPVIADLVLRR